jgi:hypothetical protein
MSNRCRIVVRGVGNTTSVAGMSASFSTRSKDGGTDEQEARTNHRHPLYKLLDYIRRWYGSWLRLECFCMGI